MREARVHPTHDHRDDDIIISDDEDEEAPLI